MRAGTTSSAGAADFAVKGRQTAEIGNKGRTVGRNRLVPPGIVGRTTELTERPGISSDDPGHDCEGVDPMGRGRAKAKQTKVARELKYRNFETDFSELQRELHGDEHTADSNSSGPGTPEDDENEDPYADRYDEPESAPQH
jgi:hypothetical protein